MAADIHTSRAACADLAPCTEFLVIALIATGLGYGIGLVLERLAGVSLPAA